MNKYKIEYSKMTWNELIKELNMYCRVIEHLQSKLNITLPKYESIFDRIALLNKEKNRRFKNAN
jgi:hypothetical protein